MPSVCKLNMSGGSFSGFTINNWFLFIIGLNVFHNIITADLILVTELPYSQNTSNDNKNN